MPKVYTHGLKVSEGLGVSAPHFIPIEGTIATRQRLAEWRIERAQGVIAEVNDANPYRDGCRDARDLALSYDRNVVPFIPDSSPDVVWLRKQDDVFGTREAAEVLCQAKMEAWVKHDIRKSVGVQPMTDPKYALPFRREPDAGENYQ